MLVKDEADIVEYVLRHLATQVDEVLLYDNGSSDGTRAVALELAAAGLPIDVTDDGELGYWQSKKTTEAAQRALARGHQWVVPCDADEVWYAPDGRPLSQYLAGMAPDVMVVRAELYNHLPTAVDPSCAVCGGRGWVTEPGPEPDLPNRIPCQDCYATGLEPNPIRRIGWRQREHGALAKVACRLRPDLVIHAGNHGASTNGTGLAVGGLVVRHFSWRTREQYCNPPEAPIWMGDLSFKSLGDVQIGDEIVGFGRPLGRRKVSLLKAQVVAIHRRTSPLVRVDFESGSSLTCTPDHLWLQHHYRYSRGDRHVGVYKEAKVGRSLAHVITPSQRVTGNDAWLAGWLAGIYDGEGHDLQIAQSPTHNPELYGRILAALDHFGFHYRCSFDRIQVLGGRDEYVRFMNALGPTRRSGPRERLLRDGIVSGRVTSPDKIVSVEPAGSGEVLGMTTTTGNYVAWGYASKNCRKIRNGEAAYAATDLPEGIGAHWRMWEGKPDETVMEHFDTWFYSRDPGADATLIYDPAPASGQDVL